MQDMQTEMKNKMDEGKEALHEKQESLKQTAAKWFSIKEDASSAVVLSLLQIPKVRELTEKEWIRTRRRMIRNTILVALPSIAAIVSISMT